MKKIVKKSTTRKPAAKKVVKKSTARKTTTKKAAKKQVFALVDSKGRKVNAKVVIG